MVSVATTQPCHCGRKSAKDSTKTNKHGWVPIKLHLWILKFEFYMVLLCCEILFFCFFSAISECKSHSQLVCYTKIGGGPDLPGQ